MNGNISDVSYWLLKIMYLIFGAYIVITTYKSIKKYKKGTLFDFFNLYYFIIYCTTPFFMLDELKNGKYIKFLLTTEEKYYFFTFFASVIVYIIIRLTYKFFTNIKRKEKMHYIDIDTNNRRFFVVNILLLAFSWICLVLWTYKFGSIFGIFEHAAEIRDGILNVQNKFAFLSKFCAFFSLLSYNFLMIVTEEYKSKSKKFYLSVLCLALSLFGTFIYMLNIDSRSSIIAFFLVLIFYFFDKKIFNIKPKTLIILFCIAICTIFLVSRMDQITKFIKTGEITLKKHENFFIKEYSYTYTNNVNVFYMYEHKDKYNMKMRFWENIKEIPYAWMPITMKPDDIMDLNDYNTSFYHKERGELPADFVTASMYTFGYIGLIINPIIYSFIIALITRMLEERDKEESKVKKIIYYYLCIKLMLSFVTYIDIAPILTNYFGFIVFYIIIYLTCGKKKLNNKYLIAGNCEKT